MAVSALQDWRDRRCSAPGTGIALCPDENVNLCRGGGISPPGRWVLLNGIIDLILGFLIWRQWPSQAECDCLLTSLNYEALAETKQHDARLRTGLIIAHALGDISRLEVDALSVCADFLTDETLRTGHRLGKEVHVWTVNETRQMFVLMKRGLKTSSPVIPIWRFTSAANGPV
jgi:hypothetical protein